MKKINFKSKKLYTLLGASAIGISSFFSYSFVDNYFEITKNLDIFSSIYKDVNTYYVDDVDPGKLIRTGIDAMLNSLDPYTDYISENDVEEYRFQITGQYGGIGSSISDRGEYCVIAEPYENYPAAKADLRAGDVLLEADGKDLKNLSSEEISKMLKGQPGTILKLKIKREGSGILEKEVTREEIKVKNVPYYGMINENVGYIKLSGFTNDAGKEVQEALKDLKSKNTNLKGIVFDLRFNGGGLLHEAVNVVNTFVSRNQLVVSTKGKVSENNRDYKTLSLSVDEEIPLVVLVNKGSASASEIVSGTIQDLDRGVIIGQRSFGKGLVQSTKPLPYGAQMKITTQKYYTPSGRCVQKLDYSKKIADGSATAVPDSLRVAFKTKNGRTVYDGGGVDPDIVVEDVKLSNISVALIRNFILFDFATQYRNQNPNIPNPKDFKITEEIWNSFLAFTKGKKYDYQTETEKALADLKKKAENEKYLAAINSEIENLNKKLNHDKDADISKHRKEIERLLEEEIIKRYYYQKGLFELGFSNDEEITEALKLFNNPQEYNKILKK